MMIDVIANRLFEFINTAKDTVSQAIVCQVTASVLESPTKTIGEILNWAALCKVELPEWPQARAQALAASDVFRFPVAELRRRKNEDATASQGRSGWRTVVVSVGEVRSPAPGRAGRRGSRRKTSPTIAPPWKRER